MNKWDIFSKIIEAAVTEKPNKCIVNLPGTEELTRCIVVNSLDFDIKDKVFERVKDIFKINDDQIKDAEKDDFDRPTTSFKGRNENSSTSEKTKLTVSDDLVEIGSYTGKFYDYYVLRRNN